MADNLGKVKTMDDLVGSRLHELRTGQGLSLRVLADRSGLNINTLSLIEHGKSSPSVSTLQQLANALNVKIGAFFEEQPRSLRVVHFRACHARHSTGKGIIMENLGKTWKTCCPTHFGDPACCGEVVLPQSSYRA
jgi:DNA-binding XRE family transcriptional regulator